MKRYLIINVVIYSVVILICINSSEQKIKPKFFHEQFSKDIVLKTLTSLTKSKNVKANERQFRAITGLLAAPAVLLLAGVLLPMLPILFLTPVAIASIAPGYFAVRDLINDLSANGSPLLNAIETFGLSKPLTSSSNNQISSITSSSSSTTTNTGLSSASLSPSSSNVVSTIVSPSAQISPSLPPVTTSTQAPSNKPSSGDNLIPFLSSFVSSASGPSSDTVKTLIGKTLQSLSHFLLNKDLPTQRNDRVHKPRMSKFRNVLNRFRFMKYFSEIMNTMKNGFSRYEIRESECQLRLICEVNKKILGGSFKSVASFAFDALGLASRLENSKTLATDAKSYIMELYDAVKSSTTPNECSEVYSKCPTTIAIEPYGNSLLNRIWTWKRRNDRMVTQPFKRNEKTLPNINSNRFPETKH